LAPTEVLKNCPLVTEKGGAGEGREREGESVSLGLAFKDVGETKHQKLILQKCT
jgi:hypothetical protein